MVHPVTHYEGTAGGLKYSSALCLTLEDRWGCVVNSTPWLPYPRERDPVHIAQGCCWVPWPVRRILPSPVFNLRTVHPVASHIPACYELFN